MSNPFVLAVMSVFRGKLPAAPAKQDARTATERRKQARPKDVAEPPPKQT